MKKKVLLGMSGGVDSSVAAVLLKEAGYDVTGAFIKNWSGETGDTVSCWINERRDATRVAAELDIPLVTYDFETDYRQHVVDYLYREYEAGRTPNPDIMCNKWIKFPLLLREANKLGYDYIATGHYARVVKNGEYFDLVKGKDEAKDQSYFLYTLNQEILSRTLFPVGELTKVEVRAIAEKHNLATAKKPDSQGICFIGEVNMKDFLKKRINEKLGDIVDVNGKTIGQHEGIFYYTIGQRHGFLGGAKAAMYIVEKDAKNNRLVVTDKKDDPRLYKKELMLEEVSWTTEVPKLPAKINVKARYRAADAPAILDFKDNNFILTFDEPQRAITPGQSTVIYDGDICLGGGIIQ